MKKNALLAVLTLSLLAAATANSRKPQTEKGSEPLRHVNAEGLATPPGYSHAVVVEHGRLIYVSGQVGLNGKGEMPPEFRAEVTQAFQNLRAVLAAAGSSPVNVVKINFYVVGLNREKLAIIREARDAFIDKNRAPASTLAGAAALFREDCHIEIEAVAVTP